MLPSHENICYCTVLITMGTLFQLSSQTSTERDSDSLQICCFNFYTCTSDWGPMPKLVYNLMDNASSKLG